MSKILGNHKEKRVWIVVGILFAAISIFLRFYMLGNKPIHFDESINMWFVQRIWEDGFFRYDPTNYHGPLLFYLIQIAQLFTGNDFVSTRVVASLFSVLTGIILWWGPQKERTALRWASLFLLLSPAFGFYGRSGIHESAFVFFQVLGFLSFHYLVTKEFTKFWWFFAAALLGMMALKETFVILILAWIPAAGLMLFVNRKAFNRKAIQNELLASLRSQQVSVPLIFMLIFFVALYTGFGANMKGLADFFIALMPWLKTGVAGNGHEKEFFHWTKFMGQYEFLTVAGFTIALIFARKNRWVWFYGTFAFFNWLIYSLIPYKTPWCLISIFWPFAILAGFGLAAAKELKTVRAIVFPVLFILALAQSKVFYEIQFKAPIDMEHPYVYVNSTYQMKDFITGVQQILDAEPLLRERPIQIATEESWPLPIVLARSYGLSYQKLAVEVAPDALIYFVDEKDETLLDEGLKAQNKTDSYSKFYLSVRQGRAQILVYLQKDFLVKRNVWDLQPKGSL
jgi:uncharacterized protein (TIGR03663 family)